MKHLYFFKKRVCGLATLFVMLAFFCSSLHAQTTHNISSGPLTITKGSGDYIITGSTTTNNVVIETEYEGTVTLRDLSIRFESTANTNTTSPFLVTGRDYCSNYEPVTKVNIVLEGDNELIFHGYTAAALQVNQGAQIHISAINPSNNASGKLTAKASPQPPASSYYPNAGAAIGAPDSDIPQGKSQLHIKNDDGTETQYTTQHTSYPWVDGAPLYNYKTAGGNIIISSGTITAHGGHGAGIGGGFQTWYNGIIIVTGGVVEARAGRHAAGLGSGCPTGSGIVTMNGKAVYADKSAVIALPPCDITAAGAHEGAIRTDWALAGAKLRIYLNDPANKLVTVRTQDSEKDANIYLDLTETKGMKEVFDNVHPDFDLTHVWIGKTATTGALEGRMQLHGWFEDKTTFFTDASSSNPTTLGRPYMPVIASTTNKVDTTVILPMFEGDIRFTDYSSMELIEGYSTAEALANAFCIKIEYHDDLNFDDITYELQSVKNGGTSDFKDLIFLGPDSSTVISAPSTIRKGDKFYIIAPLGDGKIIGGYEDVILIRGEYDNDLMAGYLRRISAQVVVRDDTGKNDHIKVTADPTDFVKVYQANQTVKLTLNIDHKGLTPIYNQANVKARYIITTEPKYEDAVLATPVNQWEPMDVPSGEGADEVTIVDFTNMASGTYYIHWNVVSGYFMAHSQDIATPLPDYGGFGPYVIVPGKKVVYNGNTNNGGVVPVDLNEYPAGGSVTVLGNTGLLTKTDATFIGWSFGKFDVVTSKGGEPSDLKKPGNTFAITADTTTLYAVWAIDINGPGPGPGGDSIPDYDQFAVLYDGNGHTSGTAPVDANVYNGGDNVITLSSGNLARTGGTDPILFAGWAQTKVNDVLTHATAGNLPGDFVLAGNGFTINDNTTMYAVWSTDVNGDSIPDIFETSYNVTYYANGATGTVPVDTVDYLAGMTAVTKDKGALVRTKCAFVGWNPTPVTYIITTLAQEAALTSMLKSGKPFTVTSDVSWYAVWGEDDNDNGIPDYKEVDIFYEKGMIPTPTTNLPNSQAVEMGSTNVITDRSVTGALYVLLGWNTMKVPLVTNAMMENLVTTMGQFYTMGDSITIGNTDVTLYAVWAADQNGDGKPDYGSSIIKPTTIGTGTRGLLSDDDTATSNETITGVRVWSYGNTLYIDSDKAVRASIYTIGGMLFKQIEVPEGRSSEPLDRGIFIVEIDGLRHKVVIKQ